MVLSKRNTSYRTGSNEAFLCYRSFFLTVHLFSARAPVESFVVSIAFVRIFVWKNICNMNLKDLKEHAKSIKGVRKMPYIAIANSLEVIPRTLVQNCGGSTIRQLTALRAKHAQAPENWTWGIDGCTGQLVCLHCLHTPFDEGVYRRGFKSRVTS